MTAELIPLPDKPPAELEAVSAQVVRARVRPVATAFGHSGIPPVLTIEAIAELFGMPSGKAALKAIRRHGVPYTKFGKRIVVLTESLLGFLKSRERSPFEDVVELERRQDVQATNLRAAAAKLSSPRTASVPDAARALSIHAAAK